VTTLYLASRFTASNGSAWSAGTTTGTWTNSQTGTGQAITIQSNQGRLNPGNGGQQATMQYTSSIGPNCAMKGRFTYQTTGGNNGNVEFWLRESSGTAANTDGYFIQIPTHSGINLLAGAGATYPTLASTAFTFTLGTQYELEFSAIDTSPGVTAQVTVRIWAVGTARPSSPTLQVSNTTNYRGAGFATLHVIGGASAGEQVDFDDWQVTDGPFIDFDFPRTGTPRPRRTLPPLPRQRRTTGPVPAVVRPPVPLAPSRPDWRTVVRSQRRTSAPVPPQQTPPPTRVPDALRARWRPPPWARRRGTGAPPAQAAPPSVTALEPSRWRWRRRGSTTGPVPPQQNPPRVPDAVRPPWRPRVRRRGAASTPVPPQAALPAPVLAPVQTLRDWRWRVVRRGTTASPVPPQAAPAPPAWPPSSTLRRPRWVARRRSTTSAPIPPQQTPPAAPARLARPVQRLMLAVRGRARTPVPPQPEVPPRPAVVHHPLQVTARTRRSVAPPLPQVAPPAAPAVQEHTPPRRLIGRARARIGLGRWVGGARIPVGGTSSTSGPSSTGAASGAAFRAATSGAGGTGAAGGAGSTSTTSGPAGTAGAG